MTARRLRLSCRIGLAALLASAALCLAQEPEAVFHSDTNLQSIGVQVTDKQKQDMRGLTAPDFTVLEDGRPQKIAFFGAEEDPISLAVLLDTSPSMESGQKLSRVRSLLAPLIKGNLPQDEIFLVPFTDRIGAFQQLSAAQRLNPPAVRASSLQGGTSLYDALATALCHLRTAQNARQAVVVITDGADQHSRLRLAQLIQLAQSSRPQIFMIGFFDANEADVYRSSGKTVTLVSGHEIDNPVRAFDSIAKETGAESFFPTSESDLKKALDRILGILRAQYTLAYYPQDPSKVRRIQVRVNRKDAVVAAQRAVASGASASDPVHFEASGCGVSPIGHPYPWEPLVTGWNPLSTAPSQNIEYHESFADPQSGWPNRAGSHYKNGTYEMFHDSGPAQPQAQRGIASTSRPDGSIVAYGPWWEDFRAAITIPASGAGAKGIVFRLNSEGCYVFLVEEAGRRMEGEERREKDRPALSFKLIKIIWALAPQGEIEIVPWTPLSAAQMQRIDGQRKQANGAVTITVETKGAQITALVDDQMALQIKDDTFAEGYIGMAVYGPTGTVFRDLKVEGSAVSFGAQ